MIDIQSFLKGGAILSLPNNQILVGWGKVRKIGEAPEQGSRSFYFPDFFLKDPFPWYLYPHMQILEVSALKEALAKFGKGNLLPITWGFPNQEAFFSAFYTLQGKIEAQQLKKGVPYTFAFGEGKNEPQHRLRLLHTLLNTPYVYGFWNHSEGMLGRTPELLFHCHGQQLETVACAGTVPVEQKEQLLSDSKLQQEHHYVAEGIQEALQHFGEVSIGPQAVVCLPRLAHLLTPITLKMELKTSRNVRDFVEALHPTAALGTFPKKEGKEWLQQENHRQSRERYGAPVGAYYGEGEMVAYVAIRNMQWKGTLAKIGLGCGVVADSDPEKEWEEVCLKFQAVREALGCE